MEGSHLCFHTRSFGQWTLIQCYQVCSFSLSICFCHMKALMTMTPYILLLISCWQLFIGHATVVMHVVRVNICMTEHFSTLMLSCHFFTHWSSLLMSYCILVISSVFLDQWQSLESSVNFEISHTKLVSRSSCQKQQWFQHSTLWCTRRGWCPYAISLGDANPLATSRWPVQLPRRCRWKENIHLDVQCINSVYKQTVRLW